MVESFNRRAANDGLFLGLYLSAIFMASIFSTEVLVLGHIGLLMLLALPFVGIWAIVRFSRSCQGMAQLSVLWMYGILLFLYASLICAIVSYLYMQYIDPDLITNQINGTIEAVEKAPAALNNDFIAQLKQLRDSHMLPSPIQIAMTMLWGTSFFGSVLSLLTAIALSIFKKRKH
ncbi:MAG: DUF4199 domain-containing protein [Muribaculaceae bacterium]